MRRHRRSAAAVNIAGGTIAVLRGTLHTRGNIGHRRNVQFPCVILLLFSKGNLHSLGVTRTVNSGRCLSKHGLREHAVKIPEIVTHFPLFCFFVVRLIAHRRLTVLSEKGFLSYYCTME